MKDKPLIWRSVVILSAAALLIASIAILCTVLTPTIVRTKNGNVSILTWNLLAPMWVDRQAIRSRGIINMNLLNDEVRLRMVADRILAQAPDILHLQEVEEETFANLTYQLSSIYSPVVFAPNVNNYWIEYLRENQTYTKNGVATFFKKKKFSLLSHRTFQTSSQGNVALLAVLRWHRCFGVNSDLILLNCHLETGATQNKAATRIKQGNTIMEEIENEISRNNEHSSVAIIAGDLNTQSPYPGYRNFKKKMLLDAAEEVSKAPIPTYYNELPVAISHNNVTEWSDWVSIDHVFIRSVDKASGKIRVSSVNVPAIDSEDTSQESYINKLKRIFARDAKGSMPVKHVADKDQKRYMASAEDIAHEELKESKINRVLRLGSDHLPVIATLQIV